MYGRALLLVAALVTGLPAAVLTPQVGYANETEEIVVSVRRKEENLQEVPIAVSTISEEQIARLGISGLEDVVKYSADLQFDEGFGAQDTRVVIRGLSPTRGRSNVAFLVDGVDFTGEAVSTAGGGLLVNQQLLDVERVEIVKGPQSALYGRSAFGGAIQYINKLPSLNEAEGSFGFEAGSAGSNENNYRMTAAYGGPVTDTLGLRVNALTYDEDGYYKNSLTGGSVGGSEGFGLALSGLWDAGNGITVSGRIAGSHDEYEPRAQTRVAGNTLININNSVAVQNGETTSLYRGNGPPPFQPFYPLCSQPGVTLSTDRDGTVGGAGCFGGMPKILTTGTMPDGDELEVLLSNDPRTGKDYRGTEVDIITSTLAVRWDTDAGQFASYTGYAAANSDQFFDGQYDALPAGDYQSLDSGVNRDLLIDPNNPNPGPTLTPVYAFTLPDCGFLDCSPAKQEIDFDNETRLFSQEFRFSSDLDGPFNYTVGALYWKETVDQDEDSRTISTAIFRSSSNPATQIGGVPPAALNITGVNTPNISTVGRDTESISVYGVIEYDITDTVKLTVEGRYIDEELDVSGPVCDTDATPLLTGRPNQPPDSNGDIFCDSLFRGSSSVAQAVAGGTLPVGTYTKAPTVSTTASYDEEYFAPKFTLEWATSDTQLYYASAAQGVKPGGISTITAGSFFSPDQNEFDKEELWSYEIGSKSTFMDGALIVNSAAFYQDYTDKQVGVTRFNPVIGTDVGSIENAGESEIWGIELEAAWAVNDNLTLSGGYTWVDAEYTDFEIETSSATNVARSLAGGNGGCLRLIDNDPAPDDGQGDICVVDFSNNEIEDVPEHSFVGNARYIAGLADTDLDWFGEATAIYRSERYIDESNLKELDAYWLVDARAGLIGDDWELVLFVDNVFDDDTVKTGVDVGSQVDTVRQGYFPPGPNDGVFVSMPDPRVVGMRLNMAF